MSWHTLKTDFVDAVWSGLRKFRMTSNGDASVSLEDITDYDVEGDYFGATHANNLGENVNWLKDNYDLYSQISGASAVSSLSANDLLAIISGSAAKKVAVSDLTGFDTLINFSNTQDIATTADALTTGRSYFGYLNSINAQSTCGVPVNANFFVRIKAINSSMKVIELIQASYSGSSLWVKCKTNNGWGPWQMFAGAVDGTITRGSMMNTSDTISVARVGRVGILNCAARIATAGTYGTSDALLTTSVTPTSLCRTFFQIGATPVMMRLSSAGALAFNGSTTVTAGQYLIGQIVFPASNE